MEVFTNCKPFKVFTRKTCQTPKTQFLEKTIPSNLNIDHVKGHTNGVCNYTSRFPAKKTEAPKINIRAPYIYYRSKRSSLVQKLAKKALEDMEYMQMISDKKNSTSSKDLLTIKMEMGELILKDCQEKLIPKSERQSLLDTLNITYLAEDSMKRCSRGCCF